MAVDVLLTLLDWRIKIAGLTGKNSSFKGIPIRVIAEMAVQRSYKQAIFSDFITF